MATRNLTVSLVTGGGTVTGPTVDVGDTITLTLNVAGGSGTAGASNNSGCTAIGNITLGTATANALNSFSGSSYSVQYSHTDSSTITYFRTISGSINATPSYTLTAPTSINEGSSGTINIATSNVATNTPLYWSVTSTGQFTGATSGSENTDSSGNASFSVTPTADSTTEGALTVTARIRTGSQSGPIVASDTFEVNDTSTTPSVTAPTLANVIITGQSTATEFTSATVNLATNGSGSGGTLQYACEVGDSTPDNWQTSNVFNNISRGGGTVYARARRSATALSNVVNNNQADFLVGDSVFSRTSPTIAHNASSATTEVGSPSGPATAGETIAVRVDGGSTNLATGLVDSSGEVDITFSSSLPSAGNSETYRLFVRRPTSTGGDGSTFNSTGMTFTVTRSSAPVASYTLTAPTSINEGSSGTINIATSNVATGTTLYWTVTSTGQFTGDTSGSEDTDSSGNASFSVTPTADSTTEGALTVTARIRTGSQGGTIVASDTFVVNDTSTSDITPADFDLQDVGPVAAGTLATTTAVTITGMDANCPCSISGQGSPQLTIGSGGVWTTSSTINPNTTINVRLTAPTAYSSSHTATLTIGTKTDTITVTSDSAPSGSGGTGTTGGTGSYGVKIFDTNGTTSVLSPSTRYMVRLTDPASISLAAAIGSNTLIAVQGMSDLSASNSDLIFEQFAFVDDVPVTRESSGFRVTNNSGQAFSNIVYAVRF